jgi:hypothetical protein
MSQHNVLTHSKICHNYELTGKYRTTEFNFMKPKRVIILKIFLTAYNLEQQYETKRRFMMKLKQFKKLFVLFGSEALIIPTTFQIKDI